MPKQRIKHRQLIGTVVSDKMTKTVVVRVERLARHPVYEKVVRHFAKYKVHDAEGKAKAGNRVRIAETRALSKDKRWRVVGVLTDEHTTHPLDGCPERHR